MSNFCEMDVSLVDGCLMPKAARTRSEFDCDTGSIHVYQGFRRLHMKMKAKRTCYPCWSCWHLTSYQIRRKSKALPLLSSYVEFLSNASGEFYSCLGILLHQMIQRCASTFFGCNLSQRSYISNELCFHLFNSISMTIIKMGTHLLLCG